MPEMPESPVTESPIVAQPPANYRLAKSAAIGLGVAIVAVLAIIIYGISAGWTHHDAPAAPAPAAEKKTVTMTLAPGYHILSSDTQPGRLILHIRSENQDAIWVLDTNDGHTVIVVHGDAPRQ